MKTIRPEPIDRWDQYERAISESWFPPGHKVDLSECSGGGELWHDMFTARSRMLEHALGSEKKIAGMTLVNPKSCFVLALCGDDFRWRQDELEDFVAFYRTGRHRSDDSFALMERTAVRRGEIQLSRRIHGFAWICRPRTHIEPTEINWNVQPPEDPARVR